MHWSASIYHPTEVAGWIARLKTMNIRWLKVLDDGGGSSLRLCGSLLDHGIMPVVRLYRECPNPGHIGGTEEKTLRNLVKLGVRYIETNNEPDLQTEWSGPRPANWMEIVANNWLYDAGKCLDAGALPAVPALSVGRKDDLIAMIVSKGGRDALLAGAWVGLHNYCLNHPLDYPDDDVNQRGTPLSAADYSADGDWAWDRMPLDTINAWRWQDKNPGATILDDASCFRSFEFVNDQVMRALGVSLPIISTEGGVVMGWRDDRRYARITPALHRDRSVAMFAYMQSSAPPYFFAMCPWLLANYFLGHFGTGWESQAWYTDWWNPQFGLHGQLPTVDAVIAMPTISRLERQGPHHSTIRGDVTAMRGVGGLRVTLRGDGYSRATPTDVDGAFYFGSLAPGMFTLQVGGLYRAGLQLDGTIALSLPALRPPVPATPSLEWDRRLSEMRVSVVPPQAAAGDTIWKLVRATLIDQSQLGTSAVSYDVLDETGRPLPGQEVVLSWPSGAGRKATERNEPPAHGAAFPITAHYDPTKVAGPYEAWIDGLASDRVTGLGLPAGQDTGFVLVFQRAVFGDVARSLVEGTVSGTTGAVPVTLHLPNGRMQTTSTDRAGHYSFASLAPGVYDLEIAQQGTVGRGILLDGTNAIVFHYAMPAQMSTLHGSVIGGQIGQDVTLTSAAGEIRHTTVDDHGQYEFGLLAAGTYSIAIGGETVKGIAVDGLHVITIAPIDLRPRQSSIAGHVRTSTGIALTSTTVSLAGPTGPDATTRDTKTGGDGAYQFAGLLAGEYTLQTGRVSQSINVDGINSVRLDVTVPPESMEGPLRLVLLLGPAEAMGTPVNLRLARGYIRQFGATVSFRVEEAERARQVLIVGDLQSISADVEDRLRKAGCVVARVGGTPYAIEDGLSRLLAEATPLPKGRAAVTIARHRPGGD
jgi:hypothetical protein